MAPTPRRSLLFALAIVPLAFFAVLGGTNVVALDGDDTAAAAEVWGGSDPLATDTDRDGLDDGAEYAAGSDPTVADTDGDGVNDAAEVRIGTDPASADTDGDGLDDAFEIGGPTSPTDADPDDDGLDDARELGLGTDPFLADTDGDRLPDGAEVDGVTRTGVELPNADPLRMTLYVRVDHAAGADGIDPATADRLEAHFASMPIENPDGSTGIDLHVRRGGPLDGVDPYTGENFDALEAASERARGDRRAVDHGILIVPFEHDVASVGYGRTPGQFLIVDAGASTADRESIAVHELLHNVLGDLDDSPGRCGEDPAHFCDGGWLSPSLGDGFERSLPEPVAEEIERRGFEN